MTCETVELKGKILEGVEYALAMVAAADLTLSEAEKSEIGNIVETPFFAELASGFGVTPAEVAQGIIQRAETILNASGDDLFDIFMNEACPAIRETVQTLNGEGKELILAAIHSLASSDDLSKDETAIISMIIDIMNE
jgi:hypothetical protein